MVRKGSQVWGVKGEEREGTVCGRFVWRGCFAITGRCGFKKKKKVKQQQLKEKESAHVCADLTGA